MAFRGILSASPISGIPQHATCVPQHTTVVYSMLQSVYHSISQRITVHCILQYTTVYHSILLYITQYITVYQHIPVYYSILQYIIVYHSISQHITVYHSMPQYNTVCYNLFPQLLQERDAQLSSLQGELSEAAGNLETLTSQLHHTRQKADPLLVNPQLYQVTPEPVHLSIMQNISVYYSISQYILVVYYSILLYISVYYSISW